MKNADMPAMPVCSGSESETGVYNGVSYTKNFLDSAGLTKREMFAMHAMQALATNSGYGAWEDMANDAVNIADALLAELEHTR